MRNSRRRGLLAALLLLAALSVAWSAGGAAKGSLAVTVAEDAADPHFPDDITFSLRAEAAVPVARVELLYRPATEETLNLVTPPFAPGTAVDVSVPVDMVANYQPPGVDIAYRWRLTAEDGASWETPEQTLIWLDDRFAWDEVGTDQVTVYAHNGDEAFNRRVLASAQETLDRLEAEYGLGRSRPIRIWLYETREEFAAVRPENTEPWFVAASYLGRDVVLAVLSPLNEAELGRIVPHEVSHLALHQATNNPFGPPPVWLDEGLALLEQTHGTEGFPAVVAAAAAEGRLYPIRALNGDYPFAGTDANLAYAQYHGIVAFIVERFGEAALGNLVAAFSDGVTPDEATQRALGVDLDGLDRLWREHLALASIPAEAA